jgi:hypothetical protein
MPRVGPQRKLKFRDNFLSSWSWCLGRVEAVQVKKLFALVCSCMCLFTCLYGSLPQSAHTNITKVWSLWDLSFSCYRHRALIWSNWRTVGGTWLRFTGNIFGVWPGDGGTALVEMYRDLLKFRNWGSWLVDGLAGGGCVIGLWWLVGVLQDVHIVCFTRTGLLIMCSLKVKLSFWKPWRHVGKWRYSSSYS